MPYVGTSEQGGNSYSHLQMEGEESGKKRLMQNTIVP